MKIEHLTFIFFLLFMGFLSQANALNMRCDDVQADVRNANVRNEFSPDMLTSIDPGVDVVPVVIDVLDTRTVLTHRHHSYGGNWPIAFYPHYQQGIDKTTHTPEFQALINIDVPMQYLAAGQSAQFNKVKYSVNVNGDDYYKLNNTRGYYDALPGGESLRVVPDTYHNAILKYVERTLITFIKRFLKNKPFMDNAFPIAVPPVNGNFCKTLPCRGLYLRV